MHGNDLTIDITGPLGKRSNALNSSGSQSANVKFGSDVSGRSALLTPTLLGGPTTSGSGFGNAMRRLTGHNVLSLGSISTNKDANNPPRRDGRLSMWGEQLHDKLFAKKDVKEVMRNKLNLHLKDENSDSPQIFQTDISKIIDFDEEDKQNLVKMNFTANFIESAGFRFFILLTIVVNSIFIALQTEKEMEQKYGYLFSAMDQAILSIFICEILLKWYGGFFTYWKVGWNIFDFVIVASSLIGPSLTFISNSRILRILRVLRAFRSLRSISALRPLQLVVQTIIQSLPDMANILLLLVIFMFVFAVIGVSLFADYSPEYFGNLETAMFTLFICITLDGWIEIFNTLRAEQFPLAAIYFVIFILIGAFILINLVVAVVVTNLESAIAEQDELDLQQMQEEKGNFDENEELKTFDLRDVINKRFWKHQKPIEVPNLPALNPHKVQNYMILVTALEDNYSEMVFLKDELSKIAREVWEWNSPVDDDESVAGGNEDITEATTKAKKVIDQKDPQASDEPTRGRFSSTLATLLSRASVLTSSTDPEPASKIRRKNTISEDLEVSPSAPSRLTSVTEGEEEEDVIEYPAVSGKRKAVKGMTMIGSPGEKNTTVPVEGPEQDDDMGPDPGHEARPGPDPGARPDLISDMYASLPQIPSSSKVKRNSRVSALRERRVSLLEEMDRRDRRGDVLSDLITMNKRVNNFSGKSENMQQFVHGVDWLRSKVKHAPEGGEQKKKWQIETGMDREKSGSRSSAVFPDSGTTRRRSSVISDNLLKQHLSYIVESSSSNLDTNEQEEIVRSTSEIRRALVCREDGEGSTSETSEDRNEENKSIQK